MLKVPQDRRKFEAFARECRPALLRLAARLCGQSGIDPEDLVQEALTRALQEQEKLEPQGEGAQRAWLCATLTNCFISHCRRRRTEVMGLPGLRVVQEPPPRPDTPREAWETISEEALRDAVGRLPSPLRDAYELHAAGLRYREIARRLHAPEGTVGSWLSQARQALRELLTRENIPGEARKT